MRKNHYVHSNVRYCLGRPYFWTSVVFRSVAEIDALIDALQALKESGVEETGQGHCHLCDSGLARRDTRDDRAEIVFIAPNPTPDEELLTWQRAARCREAREFLSQIRRPTQE